MAIAIKKYGWDYDQFHEIMDDWGYGTSLRALGKDRLIVLKNQLLAVQRRNDLWDLDDQGNYMWYLLKTAGWNRKGLVTFMIKRFHKTHWNLLDTTERRSVINMLKNYVKEQ